MTASDILSNVYFGTILRILEDLVSQVEDYESFFTKNKDKEDENDIKRIETLLELTKETVKVYNGEGGIPLKGSKFEDFTISHFPEILNNLRK
jgi:hypothetical protein